jgi:hypothetical protein
MHIEVRTADDVDRRGEKLPDGLERPPADLVNRARLMLVDRLDRMLGRAPIGALCVTLADCRQVPAPLRLNPRLRPEGKSRSPQRQAEHHRAPVGQLDHRPVLPLRGRARELHGVQPDVHIAGEDAIPYVRTRPVGRLHDRDPHCGPPTVILSARNASANVSPANAPRRRAQLVTTAGSMICRPACDPL